MDQMRSKEDWRYLFAIAYRMLGSVHEAEDSVQEAYARLAAVQLVAVDNPRAYLSTVVTRVCIDKLRSAARHRETYWGPWLPEPIVADGDPAERAFDPDSLSMAFLVLLESLTPTERAVFLLREVFGYEHSEIATVVERSEASVRQIAHRARESVAARRPKFTVPPDQRRRIGARFVDALRRLDLEQMLELVTDDVTLTADGGGRARAAGRSVRGAAKVLRFLTAISGQGFGAEPADINGQPGLIVRAEGQVIATVSYELRDERISAIFIVANPDKLAAIR